MAAKQVGMLNWEKASSLKDPALNGRWFTYIPDANGGWVKIEMVLVEHMSLEWTANQPKPRPRAGTHDKFPDVAELGPITLTFYENQDFDVTVWLTAWRQQVWNTAGGDDASSEGYYGLPFGPNGYRRNIVVSLFAKADETVVQQLTYSGCWPIGRGPVELSYAEMDGRITVSAQFAVTRLL